MSTFCLFHGGGCPDGLASAWVVRRFLGDADVQFIPAQYQEPVPDAVMNADPGSKVYLVDFSYPRPALEAIAAVHDVVIYDHHETAMNSLENLSYAVFDMSKCGAMVTWDNLFPGQPYPAFLRYTDDRDRWLHALPFTHQVYNGVRQLTNLPIEEAFAVFDELAQLDEQAFLDKVVPIGQPLFEDRCAEVRAKAMGHGWATIGGHRVPVVEAYRYYSDIANLLCHLYPECPFAACYRSDSGSRKWDLRSLGFNVSEIALMYGGGGHQKAAGFTQPKDAAIEIKFQR